MKEQLTLQELESLVGHELEPSEWVTVDQERIDQFAACTNDRQYIHLDRQRMQSSPWGDTIAHGFLTLSLIAGYRPPNEPTLAGQTTSINYGLDRVRFIQPVRVNARIRFATKILAVHEKRPGQIMIKSQKTMQIEGLEQPAMIAEVLTTIFTADDP